MQTAREFVETAIAALERALGQRGHELRNVQLATVGPEGRPGLRTLVLRGFDRTPFRAELHTDARAAKVREIAHSRHVALLAWSGADRLQLRFTGTGLMHRGDDLARARWTALPSGARSAYGTLVEPGAPVASPDARDHLPPEEQFAQFAVISIALASLDVLRLEDHGGQTRAFANLQADPFDAHWIGA